MATKKFWVGTTGPFQYDDALEYPGEAVKIRALRSESQLHIEESASEADHVVRYYDLGADAVQRVSVADIADPSTELASKTGVVGQPLVAYEVDADENLCTVYVWDTAVGTGANVPYCVAGTGGYWIAVGGRYIDGSVSFSGAIDISDDTNLAVSAPIVLTDDTLSLNQSGIDHGSIGGLTDADHISLADADGDTKVQVEEGADDDTFRVDTAGTERVQIDASGARVGGELTANAGASGSIVAGSYDFSVLSADGSNEVGIYHDNTNAYWRTDDGSFIVQTDEGTDTNTVLSVVGKGSGTGLVQATDFELATVSMATLMNGSNADSLHVHASAGVSGIDISADTNLAVTAPIVLTDDTLSLNQAGVDHGSIGGLGDNDHTQYVLHTEVDDTPVNGVTTDPVSSNWAYDHAASTDSHHAQSHNVASHSDTTITGAETETLSDNSMADALHRHSELSASDGTPDAALTLNTTGEALFAQSVTVNDSAVGAYDGLNIGSADASDVIGIYHNNSHAYIVTDDGQFYLSSVESANADSYLNIGASDTKRGIVRVFGNNTTSGGRFMVANAADEDTTVDYWLIEATGDTLSLGPNTDTDAFTFDDSGFFGILDSTPTYNLDVNGTGHFTGNLTVDGDMTWAGTLAVTGGTLSRGSSAGCATSVSGCVLDLNNTRLQNSTLLSVGTAYIPLFGSVAGDIITHVAMTALEVGGVDATDSGTTLVQLYCHATGTDGISAATLLGSVTHTTLGTASPSYTKVVTSTALGAPHTVASNESFSLKITLTNNYDTAGVVALFNAGLTFSTRNY